MTDMMTALSHKTLLFRGNIRRAVCRKLAASGTAEAVPFLISALADKDDEIRRIAEEGLTSLESSEAIDTLLLGYAFTRQESLREILTASGRAVPEAAELPGPRAYKPARSLSVAEEAWLFRNSKDGTCLAFVPEGGFLAGRDGFRVHLPPYYLAVTCVTNAQYARFLTERRPNTAKLAGWINLLQASAIYVKGNTYQEDPERSNFPVIWVTWEGASAYCKWAHLRLPRELEWEKGARGVDGRLYPWGDEWDAGRPDPRGRERKPDEITGAWACPAARSPYGLYQMIGNVFEFCADWYEEDAYQRYAQGDIRPLRHGEQKVLRGGPWRFGIPAFLRTEYRKGTVWRGGTPVCGFRCAMNS